VIISIVWALEEFMQAQGEEQAKMTANDEIEVETVVLDIRSGMIDSELMEKYHLSAKGLRNLYERLMKSEGVTIDDLSRRAVFLDDSVDTEARREIPRHYLAFLLPVHEEEHPEIKGWVVDLNDRGLCIRGMDAAAGEKKRLVISRKKFFELERIVLEAECRWHGSEGPEADPVAGFRIADISEDNLRRLREFIKTITLGDER
jgi:hypothetical protein